MVTPPKEDQRDRERKFQITPAWCALALSVAAILWSAASQFSAANSGLSQSVAENARRIEQLEAADRTRGDALARIDARTARIEATLDIMRGGIGRPFSTPIPPLNDQGATP